MRLARRDKDRRRKRGGEGEQKNEIEEEGKEDEKERKKKRRARRREEKTERRERKEEGKTYPHPTISYTYPTNFAIFYNSSPRLYDCPKPRISKSVAHIPHTKEVFLLTIEPYAPITRPPIPRRQQRLNKVGGQRRPVGKPRTPTPTSTDRAVAWIWSFEMRQTGG
ncbi:hypothetical protein B0H65DRAFT_227751 [Neurospora tetraspora]|uniref:Uncharacterized protein n=1 Tax=Neurospora tetraspora TaxID=94610 RepID=A0AAE0JD88_9PEZI|nr:hypothetical protein B0H65DRAFT_227751 [Neurospora tetraspora]